MLNVYCQYSFAGYKIFNLTAEGVREVTASNRFGIPQSAIKFLSHYGLKLAFTINPERQLMLMVNDIPCNELDDMGRKKGMSILFVATDDIHMRELAKLAASIVGDFSTFEKFIASLFTIEETLKFDYEKLRAFMDEVSRGTIECQSPLDRVYNCKSPIFVYFGEDFKASITDYEGLISKAMQCQSIRLRWNAEQQSVEAINGIDVFREYIQRILYKLHIWKDL
jgi:hypothetical protein